MSEKSKPKNQTQSKPKKKIIAMTWLYGNQFQIKVNNKRIFLGTEDACAIMMKNKPNLIEIYEKNYGK